VRGRKCERKKRGRREEEERKRKKRGSRRKLGFILSLFHPLFLLSSES